MTRALSTLNRWGSWLVCALVALLMAHLLIFPAYADTSGTIRGTVTDPSGAAVTGATVKITNVDTNFERTVTTGDIGTFELPNLVAGNYSVTVTKDGFRTFRQTGIRLEVAATYVVTASMEVGEMSATVEVTAAKLQADTTTMELGGELAQSALTDYPLLNRAWINLQTTLPGVVASSDRFSNNFATNGSRTQANNYLVNGTDSNDLPLNTPIASAINPDAIQEVKVVDSTLNPEYGRNSGATMMVTTKSGTNDWHGTAFEFYRDTFMNARDFFSPVGPGSVPPFHQNQFGGTVGGPILKNKLFFFFSYQGTREFAGTAQLTSVFSPAQAGGNLSGDNGNDLATSTGTSPFPLWGDSASACPVGTTKCAAGTAYSSLFSTGVIPTQDFSSVSTSLMKAFVPAANAPGNKYGFSNNTISSPDQYLGRLDYNLGTKDIISFYLFWEQGATQETLPFTGATLPGFSETDGQKIYQYTAGETHTFSSQLVNDFKIGYNRFNFNAVEPTTPVAPSTYGFTGINPQNTVGQGVPFVGVTGYFSLGFSTNGPQPRIDDTGQLLDSMSYVTGKHSFKWGVDFRRGHVSNPFNFLNNGSFSFAGGGAFSTGDPAADFLLGIPDSYGQSSGGYIDARSWEYYQFVQDQWKIKPNFTLTYGIGWQIDTPLVDHANHGLAINSFNIGQQSTVFPTAPAGLLFPGDQGVSPSGYYTHYNNFAPRLGFAWHPLNKLTLRGGFGIYYDNSEEELTLQNLLAPPFSLIDSGIGDNGGSPSFAAPFTDIAGRAVGTGGTATLTNKYPFTPPAAGSAVNFGFYEPFSLNIVQHNFNTPYVENRQLSLQYQISQTILATFSYVGSNGHRLEGVVEGTPMNAQACLNTLSGPAALGLAGVPCTAARSIEQFYSLVNPAISFDPLAPASVFGSVGEQCTCLLSNYNSFQASVEKTLSHGLQMRGSYTWSHSLDNSSSFENAQGTVVPGNFQATYGDSAYDARQRLVLQYLYQIPDWGFHHLPTLLTKGWTFSGTSTFQTGFPITLTESDFRTLQCTPTFSFYGCWDRPNIVAPLAFQNPRDNQTIAGLGGNFWFSPMSFAREGCTSFTQATSTCGFGQLGDAGRNFFHGPGINTTDLSFYKDTRIKERFTLQLRGDLFNAFNHASFANPNGNVASATFGQITSTTIPGRIAQLSASVQF